MNNEDLPITFRPHPFGHVVWWVIAPAIWLMIYSVFRFVEMPTDGIYFIGLLGIGVLVSAIYVSTSYCKISEDGIECGSIVGSKIKWNEIEKWTRWGENGTLFILSKSGTIIGTGSWAFYADRVDSIEQLLFERVGPPSVGEDGVLPKILKLFIGPLLQQSGRAKR